MRGDRAAARPLARLGCALAVLLGGCAHEAGMAAREAAQQGAPPAVAESLRTLNEPENQRLLEDTSQRFGTGLATGAIEGLSEGQVRAQVERFSQLFATSAARGFVQGLSEGTREELGPALREEFGAALASALSDPKVGAGVQQLSRQMSRGIVLGLDDALGELDAKQHQGQKTILERFGGTAQKGFQLTTTLAVALGLLIVLLTVWVTLLTLRQRREHARVQQQQDAMGLLLQTLHASRDKAWGPELEQLLEKQLQGEAGRSLRDLLHRPEQRH